MVEAERLLSGKLRLVGANQPLAHERGQPRRHLPVRGERLDCSTVEDLALDRSPLEHRALVAARAGRGGRRAAPGGSAGTATSPSASLAIATISVRKSGLPPAARAIRARRSSSKLPGRSSSASSAASGSSRDGSGPGGAALDQLRPSHAEKKKRRIASQQGGRLDEVEEGLVRPLDVVEQHDQRSLLVEQLAEGPRDLLGARCRRRSRPAASGSTPPPQGRREGARAVSAPRPPASR